MRVSASNGRSGARPGPGPSDPGPSRKWLGVEFRHLGALAAVAREGSFRRAAEKLGYVQSAISGQIAQLERAVGTQLISRSSGSGDTTLTPAGQTLLSHVDEIMARFEAARIDLRALAAGTESSVRVAVQEGIAQRRLPTVMSAFYARLPDGRLIIDETHDEERSFGQLAAGELDLMITELPLPSGPFDYVILEHDAYVLLVAADSSLAQPADPPTPGQLARLPLILPAPIRRQDLVAHRLRESLIDQPPWLRPRSVASVQAMVAAGLGVAVVPRLAVDTDDSRTIAIPIPSLMPERLVALVKHREREYSPAVQGFIEVAQAHFKPPAAR